MTEKPQKSDNEQNHTESVNHASDNPFLIVGIGASAGGLDAFQKFFSALSDKPDMAFVLIQHLDPNHESMMSDLLSRHTSLPVMQVKKQTRVKKNTVYIIPPGKYLGFKDDNLVLSDPPESRGMRMAIDYFFKTLAVNLLEKAICIVLSGTGSDGTSGLREVKANGGLAIVQDPETAQHDGMPRSAISTGAVDRILSPEKMPGVLLEYAKHPYVNGVNKGSVDTYSENENLMEDILMLLYAKTGHEFKHYKNNTLNRRIHRRMSLNHIGKMGEYIELLRKSKQETDELFKDLLINVTAFFRENEAWETLNEIVIPKLIERCDGDHPIRVWAPGCASGEETYSIAMLLLEAMDKSKKRCSIQIFGTDIDKNAFQIARSGRYPESIATQVSQERLTQFFDHENETFVVKKKLRESVVFAPQSLISDPPFSNQDLIICRNLMIYLKAETQFKVLRLLHFALKEDGFLFLGNSETIGSQKELFKPISKTWRIYKRLGSGRLPDIELPVFQTVSGKDRADRYSQTRRTRMTSPASITTEALVKHYAPPAVLIDRNFEILFYQGDTGDFLKQPDGEPTRNLLEQLIPGIRAKARWLLQSVIDNEKANSTEHFLRLHPSSSKQYVTIEATPLVRPSEAKGLILVTFLKRPPEEQEVTPPEPSPENEAAEATETQHLEYELQVIREELQSTIEEMETSNEELKASNEEVMSMNEELQSTNEELETSKEELQSLNEELITVNNELREKVKELEEANDDMANLLSSTHIPTVFLDRDLHIKRFTPAARDIMRIVGSDIGRKVNHVAKRFHDPNLISDIQKVLNDLAPSEREIEMKDSEHWYVRRIRPYRTQDDRIAGVVMTFVDITQRQKDLNEIKAREDHLRKAILLAPLPVILFTEDDQILMVNKAWTKITGYEADELSTISQWTQKAYGTQHADVNAHIQKILKAEEQVDEGEFTVQTKSGDKRIWHFHSAPLERMADGPRMIIAMAMDMTARRKYEKELADKEEQLRQVNNELEQKVIDRTLELEEKSGLLQKMVIELSQAEQQERRKLASTLHDNLQQLIASARFQLDTYISQKNEKDNETLSRVCKLLMDTAEACRDVTVNLAPPVLYEAGLFEAMNWMCKNFKDNHGLHVSCDIPGEKERPFNQNISVFIFQSVKELLFNVIKHAGTSHAKLSATMDDKKNLRIQVSDNGSGFDLEKKDKAFNKKGGYGLLSIQQRMAYVGGEVEICSEPGKGTQVEIILPLSSKLKSQVTADPMNKMQISEPEADSKIRTLLVDDHQIFRDGLKTLLDSEADMTVAGEASDGLVALEKARELNPHVILMDINMPKMNGVEATRRIKEEMPHIDIIGLSVHSEEDISEAILSAGADSYLPKGGDPEVLLNEIRKINNNHK